MKNRLLVLVLLGALVVSCAMPAQADMLVERLVNAERELGLPSEGDMKWRFAQVEEMLQMHGQGDYSFSERMDAIEAQLGLNTNAANGQALEDIVMLEELQPFSGDYAGMYYSPSNYVDNYGGQHGYTLVAYNGDLCESEYLLNYEYSKLRAVLYVPAPAARKLSSPSDFQRAVFSVYLDDKLVYTAKNFNAKTEPIQLEFDVSDVKFVRFAFKECYYAFQENIVLGDIELVKK